MRSRRRYAASMPRSGSVTLSDLASPRLEVVCEKCDRHGSYSVARLWRERGDMRLTDFLGELTADCPRKRSIGWHDRWPARFRVLVRSRLAEPRVSCQGLRSVAAVARRNVACATSERPKPVTSSRRLTSIPRQYDDGRKCGPQSGGGDMMMEALGWLYAVALFGLPVGAAALFLADWLGVRRRGFPSFKSLSGASRSRPPA
jgi:hypothetical protein